MDLEKTTTLEQFKKLKEWNGFEFSDIESDDLRNMTDDFRIVFIDSDYYGSHSEYGEGDIKFLYGIHPRHKEFINSLVGKDFSHGHFSFSEAEKAFNDRGKKFPRDFIRLKEME